ncbi:MAG: hypothetical protein ABI400_11075, partial [Lacisediminihabitans sp.]
MKKPSLRTSIIATAVACTAIAGVSATPAFASTSSPHATGRTLAQIQTNAATKTAERVTSLTKEITTITANTHLSSGDKSAILGTLNSDLSGMKSLATKIAADTTKSEASADYKTIFTTYRVYAVALPQARFAAATASLDSVSIPRLTATHTRLVARLAGKGASKSTPALQADLTDLSTQVANANTSLSGLSAAALAVTPAQYNSNHDVLKALKVKLTAARTALKQARQDAKAVVTALH